MNVILSHHDFDGWCSAAVISRNINIDLANFITSKGLYNSLNYLIKHNKKHKKIIIFILDIGIYISDSHRLVKLFKHIGRLPNIHIIWIDHHNKPNNIKYLNYFKNIQLILDPSAISTASIIPYFIKIDKNDIITKKLIKYAGFPGINIESHYWYVVLNNFKKDKCKFGYFSIQKILFNKFSCLEKDILSDFYFANTNKSSINNQINLNINTTTFYTKRKNKLLLVEKFNSRTELFRNFNNKCDIMLVYYNDDTIGCYSHKISLNPLFQFFGAKGHDTACIFSPFTKSFDEYSRYISKEELIKKCIELL